MTSLWECETAVADFDIEVPAWIEQDITGNQVAAIRQGGCASGAYMPAVTYHAASEVMNAHGDDVLQFIEEYVGELPEPDKSESWVGRSCFFLSYAVELWAAMAEEPLIEAWKAEQYAEAMGAP